MSLPHLVAVANLETPTVACKALLYALAYLAGPTGAVAYRPERFARLSGMTTRAVRSNLKKLDAAGLICRDQFDTIYLLFDWIVDEEKAKAVAPRAS